MDAKPSKLGNSLIGYDPVRRRVWVAGQRLHHGLTGALVTSASLAGLVTHRVRPSSSLPWMLLGSALMVHDWHDRTHWFERGAQE